ncbi:NADH-quinone oxidoreductase subunit E [Arvimicrobium flavum]|uniref:NADH-quinone oxidoreductase subunit E n=1 Tax=Arvimicrobium flavum TaxID=3393320 RepID=UPI00237B0DB9|nr:NADH-quinone oxidoreductase subunit E [Mesorhizobium shangrilense]
MSVRRLADASVQPATFAFNAAMTAQAQTWIAKYPKGREQSAVIPLMMLAQEQEGWVTKAAIEAIADMLGMPYIRALEVATFYTQFQLKPVGTRAHVQVCGTTPCMLRGSEALMDVCRSKIHPEPHHTNADGSLSWEEVECAGACVNAPMVTIFKDTYEDLTPERLAEIIDAFEAGKGASVPTGPQNGRMTSAPLAGLTSLTDERGLIKSAHAREPRTSAGAEATVPPSKAAKPKTYAAETNGTLKTPSPVKSDAATEKATSAKAPAVDADKANKAEPAVEIVDKQRKGAAVKAERASFVAPEMLKGKPIGATGQSASKPSLDDKSRPAGITRPAAVDDLKLISGVGPKIEGILHELGIFTFAQVAGWKKAEREWVDGYLNFKGRIERDDWAKQAKALAKGGVAEYVRVFGKKPV